MTDRFSPSRFLRDPHLQTIWGRVVRPRQLVPTRRQTLTTPDGDELIVDHLDTPVTAEDPRHFVLLHGLEGSSNSVYVQGLMSVIARLGHAATVLNFRSCARPPENLGRMIPNRRPRFYHSGETGDLDFLLRTLVPRGRVVACGASLGGNVLLKWLGEHPGQTAVAAAATLSVPYDLAAGARHLEKSVAGRFYVARFLQTLKAKVSSLLERFPEVSKVIDAGRVRDSRTFWEFDDAATAPLHGFSDAADYYARSSSLFFVGRITAPTLCISAADDPFLPREVLPEMVARASEQVELRVTDCGGHVGFVGGMPWKCEYWAEELVVRWLVSR